MIALHPDPFVAGTPITYVAYSVTLLGVNPRTGIQATLPDGRKVWFRCTYPVVGSRHCTRFAR
jgi:hypothetical protein